MKIIGLYTGKVRQIGERRSPTGIYKQSVNKVRVDKLGIQGDIQADKRFHGGPEKALHQYALSSYEKIIKRYPLLHLKAKPGMIGENLCAEHMNEHNVYIGDTYNIGTAVLQISSPRIPCWKIDAKFQQPDLNLFVGQQQLNGWYYRVLQDGEIELGQSMQLITRPNPQISVATFLTVVNSKHSCPKMLKQCIDADGLDPEWQEKLYRRFTTV